MKGLNRELSHYQFPPSPASIEEKTAQYTLRDQEEGAFSCLPPPRKNGLGELDFPHPYSVTPLNVPNVTH
ncbi:hypothetical protein ACRRTK_007371 [Alexandromys fortis]